MQEHADLMWKEMSAVNDMRTNNESHVPAMPISLLCRLEAGAGPELEQFIHQRWHRCSFAASV
jgi:hypothetical protein